MKIHFGSIAAGFVGAFVLLIAAFAGLYLLQGGSRPTFRDQPLPSGKTVKIGQFTLAWGVEHDERRTGDDQLILEYVSSFTGEGESMRDQETLEVFELMRPVSEQWGFAKATISVFPTTERRGKYEIYAFTRGADGAWTHTHESAKVFIND